MAERKRITDNVLKTKELSIRKWAFNDIGEVTEAILYCVNYQVALEYDFMIDKPRAKKIIKALQETFGIEPGGESLENKEDEDFTKLIAKYR